MRGRHLAHSWTRTAATMWNDLANCSHGLGVFRDPDALEAAVNVLEVSGFDRAAISVLATDAKARDQLERFYQTIREVEDSGRVSRAAFVSSASWTEGEAAAVGVPLYIWRMRWRYSCSCRGRRSWSGHRCCDCWRCCRGGPWDAFGGRDRTPSLSGRTVEKRGLSPMGKRVLSRCGEAGTHGFERDGRP